MDKGRKCRMEKGNFLEPCIPLSQSFAAALNVKAKGMCRNELTNVKTFERTCGFATLRSGDFEKEGVVLAFCPFCGKNIMPKHLKQEEEKKISQERKERSESIEI